MAFPKEIQELSDSFSSLPGIGPKLSNRIALYLSVGGKNLAKKIQTDINDMISRVRLCEVCNNVATEPVCEICSDENRDKGRVVIVEDSMDLYNIESSGAYKGLYHVLGGLISPINGITPDKLFVISLLDRVRRDEGITEIIFALNPSVEGESTTIFIKDSIAEIRSGIEMTQLAKGIPFGSDIEYISGQTLRDSLFSRNKI
jgi:recombination protein RecR